VSRQWHGYYNPLVDINPLAEAQVAELTEAEVTVAEMPAAEVVAAQVTPAESPKRLFMKTMENWLNECPSGEVPVRLAQFNNVMKGASASLANPEKVSKSKGRPKGKNRANQGDRSRHEYFQGNRCSNCGGHGHNRSTCEQ
jgi:hypothetical protein